MIRLLFILFATFALGCSDNVTDPGTTSPHKIPKVGSTFTMLASYGPIDTTITQIVMTTGLRYDGKSNVMMMEDSMRFAFEDNGDISIPDVGEGMWIRLPIVTKKDTVLRNEREVMLDGSFVTFEEQVNFLGEKTKVYNGKNFETLRFEIRRIASFYESDSTLRFTDVRRDQFSWIPELGYYSSYEVDVQNTMYSSQELISFVLK